MKAKVKAGRIGSRTAVRKVRCGGSGWRFTQYPDPTSTREMWSFFDLCGLDVPKDTKWLRFTIYDRPGVNRVDVRVREDGGHERYPRIVYGRKWLLDDPACDKRLRDLIGVALYLEVEYLEP